MFNCAFQRATVTEQDRHVLMVCSFGQRLHPDSWQQRPNLFLGDGRRREVGHEDGSAVQGHR